MPFHFQDKGTKYESAADILEYLDLPEDYYHSEVFGKQLLKMNKNELGNLLHFIRDKVEREVKKVLKDVV